MRVGFVGLGDMGKPIAEHLHAAGHQLVLHDLRRSTGDSLTANGAEWSLSPKQVMNISEVVFTCVRGSEALTAVALGEEGVVRAGPADKVFVVLSTVAPAVTSRIADGLGQKGFAVLDAPVSGGGQAGARDGTLGVYVGGDPAVLDRVRPLLASFSSSVLYLGDIGAGSTAKIVHNMVEAVSRMATAEGLTLAAKAGIAPSAMIEVLKAGSFGKRRALDSHIPSTVLRGDFDTRGGLAESLSVAYLAMELAQRWEVPVQLASLMTQETLAAVNRGWGSKNALATFLLQEERAGVQLREARPDEPSGPQP